MKFVDPWFARNDPMHESEKYAVFHTGRCGSTVVSSLFRQGPIKEIYWEGEIFGRTKAGHYDELQMHGIRDIIRYRSSNCGSLHYVFETKIYHRQDLRKEKGDFDNYLRYLKTIGFSKFVVFRRDNLLDQVISFYLGSQIGKWHLEVNENIEIPKVYLPVDSVKIADKAETLLQTMQYLERDTENVIACLKREKHLLINYEEDILSSPLLAYHKICKFTGLNSFENAEVKYKKSNPYKNTEILINLEEVKDHLRGTKYQRFFD